MNTWKKLFHVNGKQKRAGWILVSDKIDFIQTYNQRQKRSLYNYKGVNLLKHATIVNTCAPNIEVP